MRLFIFEGQAEERVFNTLKHLFLVNEEEVVCVYHCNIYKLYARLRNHCVFGDVLAEDDSSEFDTVRILNDILLEDGNDTLDAHKDKDFAEVFLFFDYDFHHDTHCSMQENNQHLQEMLSYFSDETENGKLYISYPMVEAYRYIRDIPDEEFVNYTVNIEQSSDFKNVATAFSKYSTDHFALSDIDWGNAAKMEKRLPKIKTCWIGIIPMNVAKSNYICTGNKEIPAQKIAVAQDKIFVNQLQKYVEQDPCQVSVLSAFPLFLYEYLKPEVIGLTVAQ